MCYQDGLYVTVGKSVACKGVVCFVGVTRESIQDNLQEEALSRFSNGICSKNTCLLVCIFILY